ncbi:YcaO-like family protein [Paenibacillus polymyxa]|uniref:YcaO-like family protein n=1 Tax=Paenibacillus polymyxa TaxID=1406 RepID=UPI002379D38B|nr:YcaO-like family protein [Paenibacillus polymyxa]WDM20585.1 YcaO-like family protein [Paenibacillus polymyxa]
MMIKAAPFILKKLNIYQSPFINRQKGCTISSFLNSEINGFSKKEDVYKLVKASLGEFQERLAAMKCLRKDDEDLSPKFSAFSLLNGETIDVPADFLILNHHQPLFEKLQSTTFTDSCGTAAHIQSDLAIEKGYLEFIERQSLIYSWLSKDPGCRVPIENIKNTVLLKKYNSISSVLNHISFHNISIIEDIFVIMTIGFRDNIFSVGLGADWDLNKAINSSIDEFTMIYEGMISYKGVHSEEFKTGNLYVDLFYSKNIKDFLNDISYLTNNTSYIKNKKITETKTKEFLIRNSLQNIKKKFDIEIYAAQIPSPYEKSQVKVVKIFSPDAYPHINTTLFDPNEYKITRFMKRKSFPNIYKMIPFA